jgi:hypothetical protein
LTIVTGCNATEYTKQHEVGHSVQNCFFGPLMPFIVSIPSVIRYWYRRIRREIGKPPKTTYDSVWYEGTATTLGNKVINLWK